MSRPSKSHPPERKGAPDPMNVDSGSTPKKARKEKSALPPRSEFRTVQSSVTLAIPPVFTSELHKGAEEMLDSMVMRYQPSLRGVVLAHSNLHYLDRAARIQADSPFAICDFGFDALVWSPEIGMKLSGTINLCSPDHISLLVHRTFNASIPRHHIPTDQWEFEYGPAENDPEFGEEAKVEDAVAAVAEVEAEGAEAQPVERGGRWIHKITGDRLGGEEGHLKFTVVGLTIANQMLSLVGSLHSDPFSPAHVPQSMQSQRATSPAPLDDLPEEAPSSDEDEEAAGHSTMQRPSVDEECKAREAQTRLEQEAKAAKAAKEERKRKRKEKAATNGEEGKKVKKKKT
ncbi:hypothetical protein OF83DRAFT_1139372 [Amylostereum chailletii]|nr:hypothetical protein OF83DRAFT_1139372 [Amylostereum chailletii]